MIDTTTPVPHATCQHKLYGMSCEVFDLLVERSGNCCEFCGTPAASTPTGLLVIDHDHRYAQQTVRGLVCQLCNAHLRRVDAGERPFGSAERRYHSNSWFLFVSWYAAGLMPSVRRHVDWQTWITFARLSGRNKDGVIRDFIRWYIGARGSKLPRRPQRPPGDRR